MNDPVMIQPEPNAGAASAVFLAAVELLRVMLLEAIDKETLPAEFVVAVTSGQATVDINVNVPTGEIRAMGNWSEWPTPQLMFAVSVPAAQRPS